jgi:hypothetical protein
LQKEETVSEQSNLIFSGGIPGCSGLFRRRRRYASLPCLRHPSAPSIRGGGKVAAENFLPYFWSLSAQS